MANTTNENLETIVNREIHTGSIVTLDNGRRRYAVTTVDCTGRLALIAISGAFAGCAPSSIDPERLTVVPESRTFTGKRAAYLTQRYALATYGQGDCYVWARAKLAATDLPFMVRPLPLPL